MNAADINGMMWDVTIRPIELELEVGQLREFGEWIIWRDDLSLYAMRGNDSIVYHYSLSSRDHQWIYKYMLGAAKSGWDFQSMSKMIAMLIPAYGEDLSSIVDIFRRKERHWCQK